MNEYLAPVVACCAFVLLAAIGSNLLGWTWLFPASVVLLLGMMFVIILRMNKGGR